MDLVEVIIFNILFGGLAVFLLNNTDEFALRLLGFFIAMVITIVDSLVIIEIIRDRKYEIKQWLSKLKRRKNV